MNQEQPPEVPPKRKDYWRRNIRLVLSLLAVWAFVSFGCGILLHDWLDQWKIPGTGFPLGFWFAQQGSIFTFVILIWVYCWKMNRLDDEYFSDEGDQ